MPEWQQDINKILTNHMRFNQQMHLDNIDLVKAERSHAHLEYVLTNNVINIWPINDAFTSKFYFEFSSDILYKCQLCHASQVILKQYHF